MGSTKRSCLMFLFVQPLLTNTFKITKTKTMTMIGNGLELGLRNTFWLASGGVGVPSGIVKDQLEVRWSEPYWQEYGSGWNEIERIELKSLHKTSPEFSRLYEILIFLKSSYVPP